MMIAAASRRLRPPLVLAHSRTLCDTLDAELGLRRSAAGYALEPHTDVCAKLISMVLVLPDEENSADQLPGRPRYGRHRAWRQIA